MDAFTQSSRRILPHFDEANKNIGDRVRPLVNRYSTLASEIYDINVKPYIDEVAFEFERKIKPFYLSLYSKTSSILFRAFPAIHHHSKQSVFPFANRSYVTSRKIYSNNVQPRLIAFWQFLLHLLSDNLFPRLGRFQSRYISPQLSKIQDKAWAYKARKVADKKVSQMDHELGKEDIQDEIEGNPCLAISRCQVDAWLVPVDLLSEIKAESATTYVETTTTYVEPATPIEPTTGSEPQAEPVSSPSSENIDRVRLNSEKRKALEALHDLYEVEVQKLGETEMALLADRLAALRKTALRDIPARFDPAVKSYGLECQKWSGRVEKCALF